MATDGHSVQLPPETTLSLHRLVEANECDLEPLRDPMLLEALVRKACREGRLTVKATHFFHYGNGGTTGVAVLAESHLSVHTWPEHRYAALDLFVCRPDRRRLDRVLDVLLEGLGSRRWSVAEVWRGSRAEDEGGPVVMEWEGRAGA